MQAQCQLGVYTVFVVMIMLWTPLQLCSGCVCQNGSIFHRFRVLYGLAPPYLNQLVHVADMPAVVDFACHYHT